MKPISVLIADDHSVVRVGLAYILGGSPRLCVVGEASTGVEALEMVRALRPSVALIDLGMPDMDGLEATRRIKEQFPQTRVVAMTMHDDERHVAEAIEAGVDGYLLKTTLPEEVREAVEQAARGEIVIKAFLFHRALKTLLGAAERLPGGAAPRRRRSSGGEGLSPREVAVLGLLARGLTNKEIATRLVISPGTVKRHVESILARLGASDRTDAVAIAMRRSLVE